MADIYDNYRVVDSTFDGVDGAVAYTDPIAGAYTFVGTAQLDTAQFKHGVSSLLLDGNSDCVTVLDSVDWTVGIGDFTYEGWVRVNALQGNDTHQVILGQYEDGNNYWWVSLYQSGGGLYTPHLFGYLGGVNFNYNVVVTLISLNTWHHIAWSRTGTTLYFFLNGVRTTVSTSCNTNFPDLTAPLVIGAEGSTPVGRCFNGWIDKLCIYKGIAKYTQTFTPWIYPLDSTTTWTQV